ncbi:BgTH12-07222 [Blumeria graminis f. sp. triticale]|uniref:BgTH12-07222 n=2 Tax=Blumeria graminis TaxID=34373 RepID=A0A9W4D8Y3_BLUGR|nr:hypothetical protein BGT96224_A20178 [Blumeria graminis f. sp. tritici 96224]CAD6506296.1 BgTH12-07222 [Blumeria graminis f. sp. triticale]
MFEEIIVHLDTVTLLSLLSVIFLLVTAYLTSTRVLTAATPSSLRILFVWHLFDFFIHTILEGSFLYVCFFTSLSFEPDVHDAALINHFRSDPERLYGAAYGSNWANKLWMVYAQADRRWSGADTSIISLELLTVIVGGPLALYICYGIARRHSMTPFWMIILATGELYGGKSWLNSYQSRNKITDSRVTSGFMTFMPEWLIGSRNLDTSNFMYMWFYLVFFNFIWVLFPIFALRISYKQISNAFAINQKRFSAETWFDGKKLA